MKRPLHLLALFATGIACAQPPAPAPSASGDPVVGPPAKNWVLPLFTDKEGFRTMTLRGSEAHAVGTNRLDIVDLNIMTFSGEAAAHVDTVFLSSLAHFFPEEKRAAGEKSVRMIRDDMEVTGDRWSFNQGEKRVLIDQNVRVVLHTQLQAILK